MGIAPRTLPKLHVERVALAVGIERLLVETVRPWTDEWNAAQCRPRLECLDRRVGPAQDILALHLHCERDVAD